LFPEEGTNIIAGKNGSGKSSVLDSIMYALAGARGAKNISEPIRQGEKKAQIVVELPDFIITRTINPSGDSLTVLSRDGKKLSTPQKVLDELYRSIAFDPLKFKDMSAKDQLKTLFGTISTDVTWEELEEEKKLYMEERRDNNNEVKKLQMYITNFPPYTEEELNIKAVSGSEILGEIARLGDLHDKKAKLLSSMQAKGEKIKLNNSRIEELKAEITRLETENQQIAVEGKELKEQYTAIVIDGDIEQLKEQLKNVEEIQQKYSKVQDYKKAHIQLQEATEKAVKADENVKAVEERKKEIFAKAEIPMKGLSFSDDSLLYNGVPFEQLSTSEQLKISFVISCKMNPTLKVMLIRDGSLLDSDSMELLKGIVNHFGVQVFIEVVDDDGKIGVVLEDGMIKQ